MADGATGRNGLRVVDRVEMEWRQGPDIVTVLHHITAADHAREVTSKKQSATCSRVQVRDVFLCLTFARK